MSWKVHVVIDTLNESTLPCGVTTLKTFETGFPGIKPIVHDTCRHGEQTKWLKQWCIDNGATYARHMGAFKKMEMIYEEILRRATGPTVFATGDLVFYEDMRNVEVTKMFAGRFLPARDGEKSLLFPKHRVIKEACIEPELLYIKDPKSIQRKAVALAAEWKTQTIWQRVRVVRDGIIYQQGEGFSFEIWKNDVDLFGDDMLNKYEHVMDFGFHPEVTTALNERGLTEKSELLNTYVNHAINEEWASIKGARAAGMTF